MGGVVPSMGFDNGFVLLLSPLLFVDVWVEVVMPSLPALLPNAAWQMFGDKAPIFRTV
jgi:hypothetical protein